MSSYRDLEIYQISYELALRCHQLSLRLPQFELFETGAQLRKASKRIPATIAEGYGRKKYKAEFSRFLIYAHASCDETIVHLNFIADTHKDLGKNSKELIAEYNVLGSKINRFAKYVDAEWR